MTLCFQGTRQTLMFSATFPEEVQHLAVEFLENYLFLAVGIVGGASSDVTQTVKQCIMLFHLFNEDIQTNKISSLLQRFSFH